VYFRSLYNQGVFPQTWESAYETDIYTNLPGAEGPVDAIEIDKSMKTGHVYGVKVLGALAILNDGLETNWKVITIHSESELPYNVTHILNFISVFFCVKKCKFLLTIFFACID
jgi:inorganic pyrophosphatase